MQNQETVNPDIIEGQADLSNTSQTEVPQEAPEGENQEDRNVPLGTHIKERRKRQEAEDKVKFYEERDKKKATEEAQYESVTREDVNKTQEQTIRLVEENIWKRANPEKTQKIDSELKEFLERRPNLAVAIDASSNRYEEAWELMTKLNPQQRANVPATQKPPSPGSPSGVPKGAAMNEAVDVMSMNDVEFNDWRKQKRGRR